jgi:hypothetical protein
MLIADRFTAGKNQKQSSVWEQSAVSIQRTALACYALENCRCLSEVMQMWSYNHCKNWKRAFAASR